MPAELVPTSAVRAVIAGDDDAVRRAQKRIVITPEMLLSTRRNVDALFEGFYNGIPCRVSPLFSPSGANLIGYQIEEGGGVDPGKIILPEQLTPPRKTATAKA